MAVMAVLAGCAEKPVDDIQPEVVVEPSSVPAPVFTASIDNGIATRTELTEGSEGKQKVAWIQNDSLCVSFFTKDENGNNQGYRLYSYTASPDASDRSKATLNPSRKVEESVVGSTVAVCAVYPVEYTVIGLPKYLEQMAVAKADHPTEYARLVYDYFGHEIVLPDTMKYNGSNIDFAPMAAISSSEENALEFKNLCALLAITVPSSQMTAVKSITVTADQNITGPFNIDKDSETGEIALKETSGSYAEAAGYNHGKTITLDCSSNAGNTAIATGASITFYISIPPQTYSSLVFKVTDGICTKTMSTSESARIVVNRNKIYNINFIAGSTEFDPEYVEIGGLRWAKVNLGATSVAGSPATCYGDYYAWGATEPWYSSHVWNADGNTWDYTWKSDKSSDGSNAYNLTNAPYISNATIAQTAYSKYNSNDGSTTLELSDDAANATWGGSWRMPTTAEFKQLANACNSDLTDSGWPISTLSSATPTGGVYWLTKDQEYIPEYTGVAGALFVDNTDTSKMLFFPATGDNDAYFNPYYFSGGKAGLYWSSSLYTGGSDRNSAQSLYFEYITEQPIFSPYLSSDRYRGRTIRPVTDIPASD